MLGFPLSSERLSPVSLSRRADPGVGDRREEARCGKDCPDEGENVTISQYVERMSRDGHES